MFVVLSPAKKLADTSPSLAFSPSYTQPVFIDEAQALISILEKYSVQEVAELMGLSDKLATLNVGRYQQWNPSHTQDLCIAAAYMFQGDVYQGLEAHTLSDRAMEDAQSRLRILSGLYGVLKPFDLMHPYRLEMGTKLPHSKGLNLYDFWGDRIAMMLKSEMDDMDEDVLVNLASNEYFSAVRLSALNKQVITPVFKDEKNGVYKIISFYAKKARGLMARFIVENAIRDVEGLKAFNVDGYYFESFDDKKNQLIFHRNA